MSGSSRTPRRGPSRRVSNRNTQNTLVANLNTHFKKVEDLLENDEAKRSPRVEDPPRILLSPSRVYTCALTQGNGTVTGQLSVNTTGALYYNLSSAVNQSSYTTIFDAWRILQVEVQFIPRSPAVAGQSAPLYTVIDYDDETALTAPNNAFNYDTLQITPPGVLCARVFNPQIATAAYQGTFTGYSRAPRTQWVDAASPSVRYYGLKYIMPPVATAPPSGAPQYDVVSTVIFQFRSQRA